MPRGRGYSQAIASMPTLEEIYAARLRRGRAPSVSVGDVRLGGRGEVEVELGPVSFAPGRDVSIGPVSLAPETGVEIGQVEVAPSGPQRKSVSQRRAELMGQGLSAEQAILQMSDEGVLDPRMARMLLRMPQEAGGG